MWPLSCGLLPLPLLVLWGLLLMWLSLPPGPLPQGQLGGQQELCFATPGSLKSLKSGLSELALPAGVRRVLYPGALKMALPFLFCFLDWFIYEGVFFIHQRPPPSLAHLLSLLLVPASPGAEC